MASAPDNPPPPDPPETVDLVPGAPGSETPPGARPAPAVGGTFGDYELLGEIERGGMGVVYEARDRHSGRLVALKMMLDQSASSQADLSRFVLEAQATGELRHPGIVAIHAWGVHDGHPFYTMDFVPGRPLHKVLADGPLPPARAVRYLAGMARALAAAHALGIVHRDLKPSNVMIDSADQPRVLDFGLAKRHRPAPPTPAEDDIPEVLPADEAPPRPGSTPKVSAPVTEKGAILGTPSYMAPEQVRAEHPRVGPAADVHALGAIFYEMLTGRPPFVGDSTYATLMQVLDRKPAPVRALRPQVPATLDALCRRCLAKDPRRRYPDAGALADDLEGRWRQAVHGSRFARLALLAALALVGLQVVQPLLVGGESAGPGSLEGLAAWLASPSRTLPQAAGVLDRVLHALVLVGGPLLGGLGLVVWSGAWVWHAERRGLIAYGWCAAALAALLVAVMLWLDGADAGAVFMPLVLTANALVVVAVAVYRRATTHEAAEGPAGPGQSYLQKLFAVSGTSRPKRAAGAQTDGLADFELGRRLHVWDGGAVHWARQKSLDRAVLVWRDEQAGAGAAVPGVAVRHPAVLGLHAVCAAPGARLLVTEFVAASPLAEVLSQRPLSVREALALTARVAEAVQAFHDQGACHGRLGPDWVLVNGDLEPALCPCGVPTRSPDDRAADLRALAGLLEGWLPPRPFLWRLGAMAAVYRACDAAREGAYERPADFAADLSRAERAGLLQWRERWAGLVILALPLLPLLLLLHRWLEGGDWSVLPAALAFLCPAAALAGYAQARSLVQYLRLRRPGRDRLLPGDLAGNLIVAGLLAALTAAQATFSGWAALDAGGPLLGGMAALLIVLTGFWVTGACGAGIVTFGELLARSLRHEPLPARDGPP
jgi:serine/threonine protein kinase